MKNKEPTMAKYLDRLTHREQQIICHQVRTHNSEQRYAHLHPWLLPFIPLHLVLFCLGNSKTVRPIAVIIAKLPGAEYWDLPDKIVLRDKKVHRMFGPHPEKGKAITWLPKRTAGRTVVSPIVTLVRKHRGTGYGSWEVGVAPEYKMAVLNWLSDTCG
jgi:hypothetical protein